MNNQVLKGLKTPKPMAHYCQGVLHRNTIYPIVRKTSPFRARMNSTDSLSVLDVSILLK